MKLKYRIIYWMRMIKNWFLIFAKTKIDSKDLLIVNNALGRKGIVL